MKVVIKLEYIIQAENGMEFKIMKNFLLPNFGRILLLESEGQNMIFTIWDNNGISESLTKNLSYESLYILDTSGILAGILATDEMRYSFTICEEICNSVEKAQTSQDAFNIIFDQNSLRLKLRREFHLSTIRSQVKLFKPVIKEIYLHFYKEKEMG